MAQSEWNEKCLQCKGSGNVVKKDKHGRETNETCGGCNGSGILDPADVIRTIDGQYRASYLNVVGTHTTERLLKAGRELTRQRDELKKVKR